MAEYAPQIESLLLQPSRGGVFEVMVDGEQVFEIRRRETVAELFAGEQLLPA